MAVETERLQQHTKTVCRCWIWFVLMVVTFTFIGEEAKSLDKMKTQNDFVFLFSHGPGDETVPQTNVDVKDGEFQL